MFVHVAYSDTFVMDESRRIEADISVQSMNRLSVSNDRIVSVFGDEGTFVTQSDDDNGQIFIKPSIENGEAPLSITLVTENGLTQDLILKPKKSEANTILLNPFRIKNKPSEELLPGMPRQRDDLVDRVVEALKKAVLGELPSLNEGCCIKRNAPQGISLRHQDSFESEAGIVQKWLIKNTSDTVVTLREEDFYNASDIGIALLKPRLEPGESTEGFIVRNR